MFSWPRLAAMISAVSCRSYSLNSSFGFFSRMCFTMSVWPLLELSMRGVRPSLLAWSTSAPWSSSKQTASLCPLTEQVLRAVFPLWSMASMLAFSSIKAFIQSVLPYCVHNMRGVQPLSPA
ncbi:ankyrin repeat domain-containing protein 50 [Biomphalaria glabrata]